MMSEKPYYHEERQSVLISGWVFRQMMRGAGWAAVVVTGLILIYVALIFLGSFLPEESKQAPSPYGALETASPARTELV